MGKLLNSGDAGPCKYAGHTIGVLLTWDNHTVVDVDCQYKICGYANQCELYNRHPVGFHQVYPLSEDPK